jgi:hypothetical protein
VPFLPSPALPPVREERGIIVSPTPPAGHVLVVGVPFDGVPAVYVMMRKELATDERVQRYAQAMLETVEAWESGSLPFGPRLLD